MKSAASSQLAIAVGTPVAWCPPMAAEREELARDAEPRRCSLPPADATDKLLRYEAHLDRQLYRAMDQLERLQRQRGGEAVPPPLNINLEGRR